MEATTGEISGDTRPDLTLPLKRVSANIVREWVRAAILPNAIQRLYNIGMGVTQFETVAPQGNILKLEAPAAVQRAALRDIIAIGVPQATGIVSEGDQLPGVIAVGEMELEEARAQIHGVRELPEGVAHGSAGGSVAVAEGSSPFTPPYEPPAGHSIVEVIESAHEAISGAKAEGTFEPIVSSLVDKAQAILARRRAARRKVGTPAPGVLLPPQE